MAKKEKYYLLSLKDPKIYHLYIRFKQWKDIAPNEPCSDEEREEFERYVLGDEKYEKLKGELLNESK